jgi:iron(III) transport system ATP-binding protein
VTGVALTLSKVSKSYGPKLAVDAVDMAVADGELLALVGPSGCGKSTLLRVVAGLVAADTDTVVDDGSRRADPERRDVGLVFQEHALFPHMTVGQNLTFGLSSLPRAERTARRDEWLATIGLPGGADRFPHELSGGERQRVGLARALAPRPRLMLLDEPFASLDPNLRAQIRGDVVALLREAGTAAVFVTHDQLEAMAIGDRVAVMRAGRIEQLDSAESVFHRPVNSFVAAFMGEANLLPVGADGTTELGRIATHHAPATGDLVLVRPNDIVIHAVDSPTGATKARVIATEFRGEARSYSMLTSGGATLHALQSHEQPAFSGDVWLSVAPGAYAVVAG